MAKVFKNLKATAQYWSVFDTEKDRAAITSHMDFNGLSLDEMTQITFELSCYCDGVKRDIKSPRGLLSTFVRNFVERKKSAPPKPEPRKIKWFDPDAP
jgi:hypothetical protein